MLAPEPEPEPQPETEREPEPVAAAASDPSLTRAPTPAAPTPVVKAPSRRIPVSGKAAALAAGGVIAAAAIGFLVAPTSKKPAPAAPALVNSAASGPLRLSFPTSWKNSNGTVATPGLKLDDQIVLKPTTPPGGALAIGTTKTTDPSLLPTSLLGQLPSGGPPTPDVVTLGGSQFYRYTNLSPKGSAAPEVVYALPTASGTVIGACMLQGAGANFPGDCERIVGSLKLNPDNALGLGPSADYASALTHLSDRLNLSVKQGQAALAKATKPGDQAKAAKNLAGDYDEAAAAVGKLPGNPRAAAASAALAKALRDQADAYRSLGAAASHNDRKGYDTAKADVSTASDQVTAAFKQLSNLGYATG